MKIFIAYSRKDEVKAKELYNRLKGSSYDVWIDKESLLPGQNWKYVIEKEIRSSDFVILLLSNNSVNNKGYFHKELRIAYDIYQSIPHGHIFLIPLRIEDCKLPSPLSSIHCVDFFPVWNDGYRKILKSVEYQKKLSRKLFVKPENHVPKNQTKKFLSQDVARIADPKVKSKIDTVIAEIAKAADIKNKYWISSASKLYRSEKIKHLNLFDRTIVLNLLINMLSEINSYQNKIPILLVMVGLLIDILPEDLATCRDKEKVQKNADFVKSMGITEYFSFTETINLMCAAHADCWV